MNGQKMVTLSGTDDSNKGETMYALLGSTLISI